MGAAPSLRRIRELLARQEAGELPEAEQQELARGAELLRERLDRLRALSPLAAGIELNPTLLLAHAS